MRRQLHWRLDGPSGCLQFNDLCHHLSFRRLGHVYDRAYHRAIAGRYAEHGRSGRGRRRSVRRGNARRVLAYALRTCSSLNTPATYIACLNGVSALSGGQVGGFADCLSIGGVTYGCGGIVWTNPTLPTSFAPVGPLAPPFAPTPGTQSSPSCTNPNQHPANVSSNGASWTCVDNPTPTLNLPPVLPPTPFPPVPPPPMATSSLGLAPSIPLAGQRIF